MVFLEANLAAATSRRVGVGDGAVLMPARVGRGALGRLVSVSGLARLEGAILALFLFDSQNQALDRIQ
jgi:hypothetical protein